MLYPSRNKASGWACRVVNTPDSGSLGPEFEFHLRQNSMFHSTELFTIICLSS